MLNEVRSVKCAGVTEILVPRERGPTDLFPQGL